MMMSPAPISTCCDSFAMMPCVFQIIKRQVGVLLHRAVDRQPDAALRRMADRGAAGASALIGAESDRTISAISHGRCSFFISFCWSRRVKSMPTLQP